MKKEKLKTKTRALSSSSRQNQSSPSLKLRKYVSPKTGPIGATKVYLKMNSGFHARGNPSEATISESSQIRELYETINF